MAIPENRPAGNVVGMELFTAFDECLLIMEASIIPLC